MSVEVARFGDVQEAELVASLLRSAGIAAQVADRNLVAVDPLLQQAMGGMRVMAPESQREDALAILAEARAGRYSLPAPDEDPPSPPSGLRRAAVMAGAVIFPEAAAALLRPGAGARRRLALFIMGGAILAVVGAAVLF